MDAFASSSNGIIKGLDFHKSAFVNLNDLKQLQLPNDSITAVAWADEDRTQVLCALMNRNLKLFDGEFADVARVDAGVGAIRGIVPMGVSLLTASEDGTFMLRTAADSDKPSCSKKVAEHVERVAQSPAQKTVVATGGRESVLRVVDSERWEKPLFVAKNVKDNWLCLRSPVWDTGLVWQNDGREVVTCTGHQQLRVYDTRSEQRKPVKEVVFPQHAFSCISGCSRDRSVVAGTTDGHLGLFDLRGRKGYHVHSFKGFAGSVADVVAHETLPAVLSCSPDRFVRVHNVETKQLLTKIYVKSRINRVLMRKDISILNSSDSSDCDQSDGEQQKQKNTDVINTDNNNTNNDEDEEFWNSLASTKERKRKNAHLIDDGNNDIGNEPVSKKILSEKEQPQDSKVGDGQVRRAGELKRKLRKDDCSEDIGGIRNKKVKKAESRKRKVAV